MAQPLRRVIDITLEFTSNGKLELRLSDSAGGPPRDAVEVDDPSQKEDVVELIKNARRPEVNSSDLRKLGRALSSALIAEPVASRLRDNLRFADPDQPLRLRLFVNDAKLGSVPWELAYDDDLDSFLVLDRRMRTLRVVPNVERDAWNISTAPDILIATTNARDCQEVERQAHSVFGEMPDLRMRVMSDAASVPLLLHYLRESANVLHLYTRGQFRAGRPCIVLTEGPQGEPIEPSVLAGILRGSSVPLAVLCYGGPADEQPSDEETRALLEFAVQLVQQGVPAVVVQPQGMLTDRAAQVFWRKFYGLLTAREPLDEALGKARTALWEQHEPAFTWYGSVLFTMNDETTLWPFGKDEASTSRTPYTQQDWMQTLP